MTNFVNADGSALVGALNPAGLGQALLLDSAGNLQIQDWRGALTLQGKAYSATTGLLNSASGTNTYPLSIFNPANSGKNVLIYALHVSSGTSSANSITVFVQNTTSNPSYATVASVLNARLGGVASALAASCTFTTISQTLSGPYTQVEISTNPIELLLNGAAILLPAGSANGITVFLQTYAAGFNTITARWLEF
ncbi:MAG: hypothetical protein NVS2B12_20150 [Ktedonobacteraceae bacterium]